MSRADLDTLRERARKGEIDRTSLIKALRKVRMQEVNESDWEVYYPGWVVPFGDPRINACLRLPVAYRNLLRPSSPLGTKAFTISP